MALHDFKSQRLYLEEPLQTGRMIAMSREHANYLLNVLRMKEGQKLLAFNGVDGEWEMVIAETGKKKCKLEAIRQTRQQPETGNLIYCFAPLKQARLDYMVQKAVEAQVSSSIIAFIKWSSWTLLVAFLPSFAVGERVQMTYDTPFEAPLI